MLMRLDVGLIGFLASEALVLTLLLILPEGLDQDVALVVAEEVN